MSALTHDVALDHSYVAIPIIRRASANGRPLGESRVDGKSMKISLGTSSIMDKISYLRLQGTAPEFDNEKIVILVNGHPQRVVVAKQPETKTKAEKVVDSAELIEQLNYLKERLALSVTQMAELFSVTRKTIYDWYEGTVPRVEKLNKARALVEVVSNVNSIDVRRLKNVWNIRRNGKSFLDLLGTDDFRNPDLQTALRTKLDELSFQMASSGNSAMRFQNRKFDIGESHIAEFDRRADFG